MFSTRPQSLISILCLFVLTGTFPRVLSARSAARISDAPPCPTFLVTEDHGAREISVDAVRRCIATLQERVAELEREASLQSADARRYRAGLEAAVEELNRLRPRRYDPRPGSRRSPSADLNPHTERLGSLASVELDGRRAVVRGTLRNGSSETVRGTLVIELLRAGDLASTARYTWEIPPHSQRGYEQHFELNGYAAGIYSARAWVEH